jgi:hypothetical protein
MNMNLDQCFTKLSELFYYPHTPNIIRELLIRELEFTISKQMSLRALFEQQEHGGEAMTLSGDFAKQSSWPSKDALIKDLQDSHIIQPEELTLVVNFGSMKSRQITYDELIAGLLDKDVFLAHFKEVIKYLFTNGILKQYKDVEAAQRVQEIVRFFAKRKELPWLREFQLP